MWFTSPPACAGADPVNAARSPATALLVVAAFALAACQSDRKPTAGLCKAFPAAQPSASDAAAVVDDCLHRWSYALAGAEDDSAPIVADAAVSACTAPLTRWNQQGLAAATPDAPSLITGETTNAVAERTNFARSRSLFYVVQARAGGCKPPPRRENVATAMTTPDA